MLVNQVKSCKPRHALIALTVASLFVNAPAFAKTTKKPAAVATTVAAPKGVVLTDIVVNGLQRSDPSAVFNILPVKVGDTFTTDNSQAIIKALYASGLYENVDVGLNGSVLNVKLSERSVISEVTIKGMKNFDKKQVSKGLKDHGFGAGYPYDPALLEKVKSELKAMYDDAGLVNATITSEVKEQDRKQVAVSVNIDEGKYLKVKKISIEGNTEISDHKIRSIMELNKNGIFSWYSKDSRFAPERLNADMEEIRNYYYDKGYLDFDVLSVETPSSEDGKGIQINMVLSEGKQYRVNSIRLEGDTRDIVRADVEKLIKYRTGAVFSRTEMSKIVQKVSARMAEDGYALAKIDVVPSLNKTNNTVDVAIVINPQERAYVRHVNINGNSRTKDEVIRREVRQMESSLYSGANVQLSRDRIDRLGYFSEVSVETVPVSGTNNQVDINYTVKENPTGDMKLGLGYSSTDKISLSGSINERNFMGTGNSLGLSIDTSKSSRNATFSTSNPYFTKSGISSDFSVYYKTYNAANLDISDTKYKTIGLNANFGVPISERHKLFFGFNPELNKISLGGSAPETYQNQNYSEQFIRTFETSIGWASDTRNSGFQPTQGTYQRALIATSLFGDYKYYRSTYQLQKYFPLSKNVTLAFNTQFDYGSGLGGQDYPYYRNLYAGGIGTIRGFDTSAMGPVEINKSTGVVSYLGGSKRAIANLELQFPFPGMTKNRGVRLFTFADAGGLWAGSKVQTIASDTCDYQKISFSGCNGLRYSYGLGLMWSSPIGPLKFSYALPVNQKEHDKVQRFQFQIGTSF